MTPRLIAVVMRPTPSMLQLAMQQRFWARFNVPQTRHLYLVVDREEAN